MSGLSLTPAQLNFGAPVSFAAQPLDMIPGSAATLTSDITGLPSFGAPTAAAGASGLGTGLGFNVGTAGLALSGLQTLGNLWGAFQAAKMAKKSFAFQKDIMNTNLANQIQSYNTALSDRARSRAVAEGQSNDVRDAYVAQNSLSRHPLGS